MERHIMNPLIIIAAFLIVFALGYLAGWTKYKFVWNPLFISLRKHVYQTRAKKAIAARSVRFCHSNDRSEIITGCARCSFYVGKGYPIYGYCAILGFRVSDTFPDHKMDFKFDPRCQLLRADDPCVHEDETHFLIKRGTRNIAIPKQVK
jgi:hypothetical protein